MEFGWSTDQRALFDLMRALGAEVQAAPIDDRMRHLADGGVLGLCIASEHGGGGHDLVTTAYAFEGLGRELRDGGLLLAVGAHLFGVAMVLQKSGTDEQRKTWLPRLANGECIATVAATEHAAGSDVAHVEGEVAPDGDGFLATGEKRFVTYADRAGLFFFVGKTPSLRGLTTALVPATTAGIEIGAPLATVGLRSARLAPVRFVGCRLEAGAVLGRPGSGMAVFQTAMTFERALILAFRLGCMQRDLEDAVGFARSRTVGGEAIARHQAVSHRLARMQRRLESARLLVYRAAWLLDQGQRAQAEAALAKWQLADAAVKSSLDAIALRGGAGYLEEAGLDLALDDALGGAIHSGTGDVLANIVARWLGL